MFGIPSNRCVVYSWWATEQLYSLVSTSKRAPSLTPGVGCYGVATILIAQHKPSRLFMVLRSIDLEQLTFSQLEEVQHEMKLSQLILHCNIACYICSFVVGTKLWAVQPLMHYGEGCIVCIAMQCTDFKYFVNNILSPPAAIFQ